VCGLQWVAVCCSGLQCYSGLQRDAGCASVLHRDITVKSMLATLGCFALDQVCVCVAVCCSVLRCVTVGCSVLQCVAMCCGVLQCVAVCCSVLQCDITVESM